MWLVVLAFILGLSLNFTSGNNSPAQPNFLLLVADDMGWGDLGINLPNLPSNTPNLDSLAKEGLRLTDFHSAASLCTPSRAALLTGRLGLRTGVTTNFGTESVAGLPRNETTLAEILKTVGYRTAMLGKWHLGTQTGFHPIDRGFDEYLGVPYSIDMGCTSPPGLNLPPVSSCPHAQLSGLGLGNAGTLALPLYRNRIITHQPVSLSSLSKYYAEFGEHFIRDNKTNAPFFLYAAFSHVHVPLAHSKKFSNFTGRGEFADTLAEMDWLAGRLIRAAVSRGESTIIWFMSDNGNWEAKCSLAGTSGPFKGEWQRDLLGGGGGSASKQTVWEGGHRVPAILQWKPNIKPGRVSGALTSALDIVPTISALAGVKLPSHRVFDGQNQAKALLKGQKLVSHQKLFHPNSGAAGIIGDIGAVRMGRYKVVYYAGGAEDCSQIAGPIQILNPPLVFDLSLDQAESTPLSGQTGKLVLRRAAAALGNFLASVQADNTSTVDYSHDPSARPCCNKTRPACACPWDLLTM